MASSKAQTNFPSLPMIDDAAGSVDRRGFLTRSAALAALAALASSCGISPVGLQFDQPVTVRLADYPELDQAGGVALLRDVSVPIAVVNLGDGDYTALSLVCPHQGGRIAWVGTEFVCPVHGATFADDGHWIAGQPTQHMREYATTYDSASATVTVSP